MRFTRSSTSPEERAAAKRRSEIARDERLRLAYIERTHSLLQACRPYIAKAAQTPTAYHEADQNAIELLRQLVKHLNGEEHGRQP